MYEKEKQVLDYMNQVKFFNFLCVLFRARSQSSPAQRSQEGEKKSQVGPNIYHRF